MKKSFRMGFSLLEVMVTVTLIIALATISLISITKQLGKGQDTQAKAAIAQLRRVFEDYYNDHNCYPPATWFDGPEDCKSTNLQPYLDSIPCDIHTKKPYQLALDSSGCKWFGLYTNLSQNTGNSYCWNNVSYNYFAGSPNAVAQVTCLPTFYCQYWGVCKEFIIEDWDCSPAYMDSACTGSNKCQHTGSCSKRF